MYKLDLHTHSTASPDGGISADQYKKALESGLADYIAVTDHNQIDFALRLHKQFGDRIIVGEEIMTEAGEVIGLFLNFPVVAGLSVKETIRQIRQQDGLVYIPHPFETIRHGLHSAALDQISKQVDIVEVCNGRAFLQNRGKQTVVWARLNQIIPAASSDAHGFRGLGKTFVGISDAPNRGNLLELVANGELVTDRPSLRALLYPKYHRLRKMAGGRSGF